MNCVREKKLTNIRAAGKDENVVLIPPRTLSIDAALEFIHRDELVEVTPDQVRLRKRVLDCNRRAATVTKPKRPDSAAAALGGVPTARD